MDDRTSFDAATRIAAGDDGSTYDWISIALHWTTAVLVFVNFALAVTWDWFAKPAKQLMEQTHMSLGVLLTAAIVARLAWRWLPGHQLSSLETGWMRLASKATHSTLCWSRKRCSASRSAGARGGRWPSSGPASRR